MGDQEEGRGRRWKKTSTQKFFTDGMLAHYFREETSYSHHTEQSVEYVFLDTMLTDKHSCNWQEWGTRSGVGKNNRMLYQL